MVLLSFGLHFNENILICKPKSKWICDFYKPVPKQRPSCSWLVNQKVKLFCGWVKVNRLKVRFGVAMVLVFK